MRNRAKPCVIIGAGDHGRVVLELLRASGISPLGFVEPEPGKDRVGRVVDGVMILGNLDQPEQWLPDRPCAFLVALGDNLARKEAFERAFRIGLVAVVGLHPAATVLGGATIEPGAAVCAGALVGVGARVRSNAIVNTAATVDHDDDIGEHATIAPGAHLAGRVVVGEGAYIGIGAAVREGIVVGSWAFVGGGAMVTRDVDAGQRVVGVPARPIST